jgi:hypothetical protein
MDYNRFNQFIFMKNVYSVFDITELKRLYGDLEGMIRILDNALYPEVDHEKSFVYLAEKIKDHISKAFGIYGYDNGIKFLHDYYSYTLKDCKYASFTIDDILIIVDKTKDKNMLNRYFHRLFNTVTTVDDILNALGDAKIDTYK